MSDMVVEQNDDVGKDGLTAKERRRLNALVLPIYAAEGLEANQAEDGSLLVSDQSLKEWLARHRRLQG